MSHSLTPTPSAPSWLEGFANDAARSMLDSEMIAPIGCHYHYNENRNEWEVTVFISATEVVGGARDGMLVPCCVQLNVSHVIELFAEMPTVHWQSGPIQEDDEVHQHVSFEGRVHGHNVWLRMLAQAPGRVGPGRLLHASTGELENLW